MATNAIVDLVQQRIGEISPETAERLINAVLETLAERDLSGAHTGFAAELPPEYGAILNDPDRTSHEHFDVEEFIRRVGERANVSYPQSETWTRAALTALVENVPTEERNRFVSHFPDDLADYTHWVV
ncbi:hypothetical protein GCM10023190_15590 [Enteractinococcus fodinae]|uniref:Uncharacterized protein (DUF2267 family) n=1 Tax=Enteractinococcus fodinae TaxID=684663 RepID=A0ABU2AX86_9MICC|nr:DUF2267 domain-containing protein [Enteractinococcus fodinae]MDR7345965.1 uncharacterized protein (DUF2267 family) [Enteractinococcus fodinae]